MINKHQIISLIVILSLVTIGYKFFYNQSDKVKPPITITKPDFNKIIDTDDKKTAFFAYLSPYIDYINRQILADRQQLLTLAKDPSKINPNSELIQRLVSQYQWPIPKTGINNAWLSQLLQRVNILPLPMVLAQAAMESSWGTSRFATAGNSYFGQWCFTKGCGIVPLKPDPQNYHEVQKFPSTQAAVQAYFDNINTNQAYAGLRATRAKLQQQKQPISAQSLVQGLDQYSQIGHQYIRQLLELIQTNKQFMPQQYFTHNES
ncbi:glucosaminidase domain-containing protein [Photobacterium kishitanii]|uniref:Glucosaminidase n=1 Tax=Photobacterium kishitanii TaxID=318456 RepID=A0A2T3KFT3_9GAMM|nr:glucosaminidase domain-containing protein [Photobacterium kishitanii]PSU97643.1 glucosaminidase [Photobacterium kishitanii]PSV16992.1 glucosaminidase [Photobacterium kishitanii]